MNVLRLRPTFHIELQQSRLHVMQSLREAYEQRNAKDRFLMFGEYGEFHLEKSEHRLWSPHLSFYVASRGTSSSIHGRFAPRLEVWTFVWVLYLAMSFSTFFGLAFAYSQWALGEYPWGAWVAALGLSALAAIYTVACVGQQLSHDQMQQLRQDLDGTLLECGLTIEPTATTDGAQPQIV